MLRQFYRLKWFIGLFVLTVVLVFLTYSSKHSAQALLNKVNKVYRKNATLLPWYFREGSRRPKRGEGRRVWPEDLASDRIHEQLFTSHISLSHKTIYVEPHQFQVGLGNSRFEDDKCPVRQCSFIHSREEADAVIFKDSVRLVRNKTPESQIWILYVLESPMVSGNDINVEGGVNWTATYREDSDIVTPYEKWMYYDEKIQENTALERNYASGKTKKVAWFVSNCQASNKRLEYARELKKYISVDIYGKCGEKHCDKSNQRCNDMLNTDYKFYLAFENSNCRDYITEKFYVNGLGNDIVPIVMGAHPDDYRRAAPKHSYIHVDDFPSARDLADYLNLLDANDDMYNAYFKWKGTGEFINTHFFCRVCAMLHNRRGTLPRTYSDFRQWWAGGGICRNDGWMT